MDLIFKRALSEKDILALAISLEEEDACVNPRQECPVGLEGTSLYRLDRGTDV